MTLSGQTLRELEKLALEAALRESSGNKKRAAESLGISRRALYDKIKSLGVGSDEGI